MNKATRIKVAEALNNHFASRIRFTEEKVKKFKLIHKFSAGGSRHHYDIYATQLGDLTIMLQIFSDGTISIKAQAW